MKKYRVRVMLPALLLAATLILGFGPAGALAQCGGNYGNMHGQQMGYSGQMGMYANQAPIQQDPNAIPPGYVKPVPPPVSGYTEPQNTGGHGQMTGQGGMGSGHTGHMGQ